MGSKKRQQGKLFHPRMFGVQSTNGIESACKMQRYGRAAVLRPLNMDAFL
jgi:hypothetical protein